MMKLLAGLTFLTAGAAIVGACASPQAGHVSGEPVEAPVRTMTFQQIRNATVKLGYAGTTFLVDPILAKKGAYPGFEGTYNSQLRNPLVELPLPVSEVVKADAVVVTHRHPDHWDAAASASIPRNVPIFVQDEEDAASMRQEGFTDVRIVTSSIEFRGTRLTRTSTQHGTHQMYAVPEVARLLGQGMGVVFSHPGYKTTYIAGDTIWTPGIEAAIKRYQPDVIVLNTGYARLLGFEGSIIMGKEDLLRAYRLAPNATIVGSHMEAFNHMTQSRKELRDFITEKAMDPGRVLVPEDGESYRF